MYQRRAPAEARRKPLPDHPDLALFVATLFERLGGRLEIDADGRRHVVRPEQERLQQEGLPQLADARPWEQFHSREEWQGALKLAEYWLNRLSGPDMERVFTYLAAVRLEAGDGFDFRKSL